MKSLLVVLSYHHKNTEKIANVIAQVLDAPITTPQQINSNELVAYDLIGFGSGIYSDKHHPALLNLVDQLPHVTSTNSFIFSTCGAPARLMEHDKAEFMRYVTNNHSTLKEKLQSKGYTVVDEFSCPGWNTNSFLKLLGGINRGRPSAKDLEHAEAFAQNLKQIL
jgi:flavodoxin